MNQQSVRLAGIVKSIVNNTILVSSAFTLSAFHHDAKKLHLKILSNWQDISMNQWSVRPYEIVERKVTHSLSTSSRRKRIQHMIYCLTTAGKKQQSQTHENQQQEAEWDASRGRKRMQVQGLTRERVAACLRRLLGPLLLVCASRPDP